MIDAIACESHFLDHLAPVWLALPPEVRGRFIVDAKLLDRAAMRGIEAEPLDADLIRRTPQKPPRFDGTPALVASIGDTKVGRRLGYGPFVRLEHGAGQGYIGERSGSYAGGPGNSDAALILVPNTYSADLWRNAYPGARVEIVGSPRLDGLPARDASGTPPVLALAFHWPGQGYAGTAFGDFRNVLPALADRYTVIGHQHPNWLGRKYPGPPSRYYAQLGIEYVPEFEDICRRADLYIADNTSTSFEFAATGRPVLLLNARWWSRKFGHGGRFWDWAHVGANVDRPEDLMSGVERALIDGPNEQTDRADALSLVYGVRSGGATLAADAIVDWLGSRQEVAA